MVRLTCKASTVIEMAYLMPVVLLLWALVIYGTLLFHDKAVISAAAYETVVVGREAAHENEKYSEEMLGRYFQERVSGKMLFFKTISANVNMTEDRIQIYVSAENKGMHIKIEQSAVISTPEENLRKQIIIKEKIEGMIP